LRPDLLLLIGGFGIIKAPLLDLAPQGVLSYHHGDMREYRGQPPAFWELYNGEKPNRVTVQRLSPGIDCGQPIVE
jgi:methionyl-tRNA formyltransferase